MTRRRKALITAAAVVIVVAVVCQIDVVRQQIEIAYMTVTHSKWRVRGHVVRIMVRSDALQQSRRVYVYTPPGYDDPENAKLHYCVLYLLHGSPDLNAISWIPYGRAPSVVDRLIVEGKIPPVIVVCPDGQGPGSYGDSEYIDAPDPRVAGKPGTRVATFITRDLVNYLDSSYRTINAPAGRWIGGVSTGGYGAVNLGLHHPELYGTIVSLSGYFIADPSGDARKVWGYNPSPERLYDESPYEYIGTPNPKWSNEFLFLGDGANEPGVYKAEASDFAKRLTKAGIPYVVRTRKGRHSWDLWRQLLEDALVQMSGRIPKPS